MQSRESYLAEFWQNTVEPFWQQHAIEWVYQPQSQFNIQYALLENPQSEKCIILLPGRVESFKKYKELAYDFYQLGYSILTLDHRGQGLSHRETDDPELGYISDANLYADDLHAICCQTRIFQQYQQVDILAHSMGSLIAIDFVSRYQPKVNALAMSSPLLGINAGPLNHTYALKVVNGLMALQGIKCPEYFINQTEYHRPEFANNSLCGSQARFELSQDIQADKVIRLGGVTYQWLQQIFIKFSQVFANTTSITVPCLVLQAELESIVKNQSQNDWVAKVKQSNPHITIRLVKGAKHEILMESDTIRGPVIEQIHAFFEDPLC
ncbi:hypothetical protein C2869_08860 [Saccharobesus litoralis]|uniref:Serine aminopeptidase S33 domain-containing protein n=1 Tax=Saccharobesus litoralis TaxID=2172099 RepID=A0A2S0VQP1_9ALTE|nr:alpha/beta fold hydrolase [Saccharobesus litoralis]AWB66531.1 hypothetical protein C2869_08860 [Saccharobesus litoralis]